jgi:Transcriptional accessory protein
MKQAGGNLLDMAQPFLNEEKGVLTAEDALAGARDIIAESASEHTGSRAGVRQLFARKGVIASAPIAGKEEEGQKYRDYFDVQTPVSQAPSHRILALFRGEKEGVLALTIAPPPGEGVDLLERTLCGTGSGQRTSSPRRPRRIPAFACPRYGDGVAQ